MRDEDRYRLHFGPYSAPAWRLGEPLTCEYQGRDVRVGGLTDAPIPWPRALKTGKASLIVCGDLVRAIRRESKLAICHHWGVSGGTVLNWRRALGVGAITEGTGKLYSGWYPEKITGEAIAKSIATQRTPEARKKRSESLLGHKMHPNTRKALLRACRKKRSKATRKAMSEAQKKRWRESPPSLAARLKWAKRAWTDKEHSMLGKTFDRAVARMIGRTIWAVRNRRIQFGIPESRHSRLSHEPKPKSGGLIGD